MPVSKKEAEQISVRLPLGMRASIRDRASKQGRSVNSEIVMILRDVLEKERAEPARQR